MTMKFLATLISALALCQNASAFSISKGASVRPMTSLDMTVEENETKTVRVGVIGCGRIGLVHLEAITKAPGVIPVIVSNPTVSKAEAGTFFFYDKQCSVDFHFELRTLNSSLFLFYLFSYSRRAIWGFQIYQRCHGCYQ